MPKWEIPVTWEMFGRVFVEADTLYEAILEVERPETPLPTERDYVEGSFKVETAAAIETNSHLMKEDEDGRGKHGEAGGEADQGHSGAGGEAS